MEGLRYCLNLRSEFGNNQPKWVDFLLQGYFYTLNRPRGLNRSEFKNIFDQVFMLILYILDYHNIDVRTIAEFAGIERTPLLMCTAGQIGDVHVFLPRFLLETMSNTENHLFSDRDRELCDEWNIKETVASRTEIQKAYEAIRLFS
ncbi:hypothetical protein GEMRC1_002481 [Eukaryota sp. GEM-RC1]